MTDRRDSYYQKAKRENFRSRAVYKLREIENKFRIVNPGDTVLEIGSAPGGWTQYLTSIEGVRVVSVDRTPYDPVENSISIKRDIFSADIPELVADAVSSFGKEKFNAVVSDAMSNTSGNHSMDHASSYLICDRVLSLSLKFLYPGGNVLVKHFQGDMTRELIDKWSPNFRGHKVTTPKASRSGSREIYIIFFNLLNKSL
ncbi:MAG: 23S rRNA (uridine(2552)-2'-O)-methyltransferase [Thermoplasmatales archaeon B_DKE]|nr:MAG: 23S rRNA (uridine(2552)-2'-O)-methyltransferase [Thermoplasmatales archaeon B_DKE]